MGSQNVRQTVAAQRIFFWLKMTFLSIKILIRPDRTEIICF
jgi:hypothetical protein